MTGHPGSYLAGGIVLAAALAGLVLHAASSDDRAHAAEAGLERFFGTYVGVAEVEDFAGDADERRHMDVVIEPYDENGFRLHWVNVSLVDGRRDVPGVERRVQSVLFAPATRRDFYVEVEEGSVFREREEANPMGGDPVRWAAIDGDVMHVNTFVVHEDGRYELQTYDRILTETGIDIEFQQILDGELLKRITGTTARARTKIAED